MQKENYFVIECRNVDKTIRCQQSPRNEYSAGGITRRLSALNITSVLNGSSVAFSVFILKRTLIKTLALHLYVTLLFVFLTAAII